MDELARKEMAPLMHTECVTTYSPLFHWVARFALFFWAGDLATCHVGGRWVLQNQHEKVEAHELSREGFRSKNY